MTSLETDSLVQALLVAVLDRLVPAGDGFPGAGEVAAAFITRAIAEGVPLAGLMVRALDDIETAALDDEPGGFIALPEEQQDAVLKRVETESPEAFEAFLVQTYAGYYSQPTVHAALGLDPRPPQPRGHVLEPFNERLLAKVRQREPFYRRA